MRVGAEAALAAAREDPYNAFLHVVDEVDDPAADGPLAGVALSVKDNLAVAGMPLTCASRHLEDHVASYTATVVERLMGAGAVVVGKTNLDEFGCGTSGESSAFGATMNPVDAARVPGGSSSGAAASVAAGAADLALGSDTGGSVRCPASFCGVVGFKPTNGRVSRYGLVDMAMSLEVPGFLARDVATVARGFDAASGEDARDTVTRGAAEGRAAEAVEAASAAGLRVGVVREFMENLSDETSAAVQGAVDRLEDAGADVTEVRLPSVGDALAAYYVTCYAEFSSAMQRYDGFLYGHRADDASVVAATERTRGLFGAEVKRRILLGTFVTQAEEAPRWYAAGRAARARLAGEVTAALEDRDVLVGATMPFPAFPLGERVDDPLAMYAADVLTVAANLGRVPAGSVPVRVPGNVLPVGLQVLGARGEDERVLAAMATVERVEGVST